MAKELVSRPNPLAYRVTCDTLLGNESHLDGQTVEIIIPEARGMRLKEMLSAEQEQSTEIFDAEMLPTDKGGIRLDYGAAVAKDRLPSAFTPRVMSPTVLHIDLSTARNGAFGSVLRSELLAAAAKAFEGASTDDIVCRALITPKTIGFELIHAPVSALVTPADADHFESVATLTAWAAATYPDIAPEELYFSTWAEQVRDPDDDGRTYVAIFACPLDAAVGRDLYSRWADSGQKTFHLCIRVDARGDDLSYAGASLAEIVASARTAFPGVPDERRGLEFIWETDVLAIEVLGK